MSVCAVLVLGLSVGLDGGALAEPTIPIETYAQLTRIVDAKISPDGETIAVVRRGPERDVIDMVDRDTKASQGYTISPEWRLDAVTWVGPDQAFVEAHRVVERGMLSDGILFIAYVSVAADGSESRMMMHEFTGGSRPLPGGIQRQHIASPLPHREGKVLVSAWAVGNRSNRGSPSYQGSTDLFSVNLSNGVARIIRNGVRHRDISPFNPRFAIVRQTLKWVVSADHEVYASYDRHQERGEHWYALRITGDDIDDREFDSRNVPFIEDLEILAFAPGREALYGIAPTPNGTRGLYTVDIETGQPIDLVYAHPDVDVSGARFDYRTDDLLAVNYIADLPEQHVVSSRYGTLQRRMDETFPKSPVRRVLSSSEDERFHTVRTRSPQHPDRFYLVDMNSQEAYLVGDSYPDLDGVAAATVAPVQYEARDGQTLRGYLTTPPDRQSADGLPLVVMPHDGPNDRDYMKFDPLIQLLAQRGYAVFQPNYRGSTGYGPAFEKAGFKEWGGKMQHDVADGTKHLIDQGVADPNRICIMGQGYGGYAALMGEVLESDLYACVIAVNAITDLPRFVRDARNTAEAWYWEQSAGSLDTRMDQLREASPIHRGASFNSPVLLLQDKDEPDGPMEDAQAMRKALEKAGKDVEFIELDGDGHGMEHRASRLTIMQAMERFLARHIGG